MTTSEPSNGEAPPNYLAATSTVPDAATDLPSDIDLTSSYASLSLSPTYTVGGPDVDTCLAHLKFLHAVDNLKEEVGYSDGLFGIWDNRAVWDTEILHGAALPPGVKLDRLGKDERTRLALSRLREKRWAIYLARAVDRYEAWWSAMTKGKVMLTEEDMMTPRHPKYALFTTHGTPLRWSRDSLPPLGKFIFFITRTI